MNIKLRIYTVAITDESILIPEAFLSVFWISNANNAIHNNAAVGGEAGFWAFAHIGETTSPAFSTKSPTKDENGLSIWRNNKASACNMKTTLSSTIHYFVSNMLRFLLLLYSIQGYQKVLWKKGELFDESCP